MKPYAQAQPTDSQDIHSLDGRDKHVQNPGSKGANDAQNKQEELQDFDVANPDVANPVDIARPVRDKSWRRRRQIAVLLVVGIALASGIPFAYFTITKDKASTASAVSAKLAPVVTVTTVPVTIRPVDTVLTVTGTVSPWDELNIGSEQGGLRIDAVNFEEGDLVKKGQLLVKLNSAMLEAKLAEQQSMLDSYKALLTKAVNEKRPEEIAVLKSTLAQDEDLVTQAEAFKRQQEEKLKYADINVERFRMLAKEGAKSDADFEVEEAKQKDTELELISANHKVEAARRVAEQARENLSMARKGGRTEDIAKSKSDIEQNQARIKQLSEQIKETAIRAADDGLIVKRDAHIGDICDAGKPLFTMVRLNRLELKAQANDVDLHKFQPGQTVTVFTSEAKSDPIVGKIRLVSPQIDSSSRLGTVHIDLPKNSGLKSGMFVRGEILLSRGQALTVPISSVVSRGGESVVFRLDGNRAISMPVVTGAEAGTFIEIKSGLTAGQQIVDKGARFLSDRDVVGLAH